MEKKFHCVVCKNVGGTDGYKYKCSSHKSLCSDCVERTGFFRSKTVCQKCGKETIEYEWSSQKKKWEQV